MFFSDAEEYILKHSKGIQNFQIKYINNNK